VSGIVGILNLDGAPVDRELLHRMTGFMRFRGPDAQEFWSDGSVGFGHALLRTTDESLGEHQPWSPDGRFWISADARIDARQELIAKLTPQVATPLDGVPDAELILHAYQVWGDSCLEHLLGDFAFAIWDTEQRRLFCARDPMGVKPFFYARLSHCLVFSNTLNCVRLHPSVSERLNRRAIDEFLQAEEEPDPQITTFADIQRLLPGHCLSCADGAVHITRYWALPLDDPIHFPRASDYVERFRELLRQAVADRLRTRRVVVSMSGGLDSTTIAAVARQVLAERGDPFELRAHTVVYDRLFPDPERRYAGMTARALGIPIDYLVADDYQPFGGWERPELRSPEPRYNPYPQLIRDSWSASAARGRVLLIGYGPDFLLRFRFRTHVAALLRQRQVVRLICDVRSYLAAHRGLPWANRARRGSRHAPAVGPASDGQGSTRPRWEAEREIRSVPRNLWFRTEDPGETLAPIEPRYPYLDLRLLRYLLAVPPIPWCLNKTLLRRATRGMLPEPVRRRPKTPLAGEPLMIQLRSGAADWIDLHEPSPELAEYIPLVRHPLSINRRETDSAKLWMQLLPFCLDQWLRQRSLKIAT
jgi:asparagine synthase (glutamine-hydrolysing)